MSFHDALPADVKMRMAGQPEHESAPVEESEPNPVSAPRGGSESASKSAPQLKSEPLRTRAPMKMSASPVLAGREEGKPALWGFVCAECKFPVDEHVRGRHKPGCTRAIHNQSLLEGAEEFAE